MKRLACLFLLLASASYGQLIINTGSDTLASGDTALVRAIEIREGYGGFVAKLGTVPGRNYRLKAEDNAGLSAVKSMLAAGETETFRLNGLSESSKPYTITVSTWTNDLDSTETTILNPAGKRYKTLDCLGILASRSAGEAEVLQGMLATAMTDQGLTSAQQAKALQAVRAAALAWFKDQQFRAKAERQARRSDEDVRQALDAGLVE